MRPPLPVAALQGGRAFVPPSGGLGRAYCSTLSNNGRKNGPCGSSDSGCSGARAACARPAAEGQHSEQGQRQRHRRRQRHVLKAQMTDEEFALDQVKHTGAGAALHAGVSSGLREIERSYRGRTGRARREGFAPASCSLKFWCEVQNT